MLQLVREIPIQIVIQGTLSSRRGFLFYMAAGFSKSVDPLSGMSVNLTLVDQWLQEARQRFSADLEDVPSESPNSLLVKWATGIRDFLNERAQAEGACLSSVSFREARGWSLSWDTTLAEGMWFFSYSYYVETLPLDGTFDLLKVHFFWLRQPGCMADYQHESFKLLKTLNPFEARQVAKGLSAKIGKVLESGSTLHFLQIESLGKNYKLQIP